MAPYPVESPLPMPPVVHRSSATPNTASSVGRDASRVRDSDLADFDLRVTLSDISLRETSFAEFLAALKNTSLGNG
jgi:hypothetical protein